MCVYCLGCSDPDNNRSISFPTILQHQHQQITAGTVSVSNSGSWTKSNIFTVVGETGAGIQMGTRIQEALSRRIFTPLPSFREHGCVGEGDAGQEAGGQYCTS